jgi:hypothetical protein
MYFHDQLMHARQDELLKKAARHRLAATARRARRDAPARAPQREGSRRPWAQALLGAKAALAGSGQETGPA